MTDFLESVLSSMSSAFNSSPTPADGTSVIDLNLNDDKTLKWRSLLNNSNALKSGKKSNLIVEQQNQQQQNHKHHHHHQHQQQQQQQQGTFININTNININNTTNNNQREEEGENKMSQGQDNISYTSSNTNSSNEITNSNNNNNSNRKYDSIDKEKKVNSIITSNISVVAATITAANNNINNTTTQNNNNKKQHNNNCNEIIMKNHNNNKRRKINTRRRKNLQNKIKKPLENYTSASRRSRRSRPLEISMKSNVTENKRMTATSATTSSSTTTTVSVSSENIPKRRGRSKKVFETNQVQEIRDNSPKKQQQQQNIHDVKNSSLNDVQNIKGTDNNSQSTTATITTNQEFGNSRQQSPSGRKLRRSERNSIPSDEIKTEEIEIPTTSALNIKSSNESKVDETNETGTTGTAAVTTEPKVKRIRRSERLESRYEVTIEDAGNKIQFMSSRTPSGFQEILEIKEEPKKSPESNSGGIEEIIVLNDEDNEKKPILPFTKTPITMTEIIPKKRGRRTKIVTPEKTLNVEANTLSISPATTPTSKRTRNSKEIGGDTLTLNSNIRKEKTNESSSTVSTSTPVSATSISQRPLRRIKPTVKILENEELRYEFETKNIARMTACSDMISTIVCSPATTTVSFSNSQVVETSPTTGSINSIRNGKHKKDEVNTTKEPLPKTSLSSSLSLSLSTSLKDVSNKTPQSVNVLPPPGTEDVKRKLFPPIENNLNVDNIYPASLQRPCPDPQTFLSEIKAAKINLHKSPENKKLNRKQHRKLLKQKEKHFEKLGLRKNLKDNRTETEDSSTDNEEFLPPKKLNVGKPNVTLRLRNKEEGCSVTNSVKQSQQKLGQRKRVNSHLSSIGNERLQSQSSTSDKMLPVTTESHPIIPLRKEIKKEQTMICLCQKTSHYYTRNTPETAFCCAIDSIEDEKVGCCNQLNGELLNLLRPSHRVGYMILCDDHKKRLLAHNCCASCGIFCTQGKFILCKQEHFFHAECAQKYILNTPYDPTNTMTTYPSPILVLKCPHCGRDTPEKTSLVTMKCNSLPVFLPSQRALIKPAKMTIPEGDLILSRTKRRFPSIIEMDKLIPESVISVALQRQTTEMGGNASGNSADESEFTSRDMFYAINHDDLERVAEIIASGYDVTCEMPEFLNGTCLHLVAHFGTVQMAYLLLCRESSEHFLNMVDKELRTPAMCAVIGDKCDILKLFVQCGADLSLKGSDGMTCLHMAAKLGSVIATRLIVENYKNCTSIINFDKFINLQDDGGWTAMVWAAENGFTDIVSYLISHGADTNVCDTENNTVLHWATLSNRIETIMVLLQANINCNQQNVNGDTPLHIACRQSSTRICLMLIANGADLMVKNKALELPYDCIPNEESQCARAVGFNMQMRSFGPTGLKNKIICSDISNGRETHPIQAVRSDKTVKSRNNQDQDDDIMLPDFKYITKSILLQNSIQIDSRVSQMRVCSCSDGCNTDQCQCSTISVQNWYTPEGRLNNEFCFEDPPMIFECNDVCGCNKLICKNRVVQNGIKIPLQIFECEQRLKGWGVRCLIQIPRGTFISEYTGEILTDLEADRRTDDSYFFDLGASDHCIDANYYGNISRFYNHSCTPNIVPVRVYYENQDYRFPKIAFFACKDIMSGEELCFDYGDKFWAVKQKYFSCQCKSLNCRYSNTGNNSNSNTNISAHTNNNDNNVNGNIDSNIIININNSSNIIPVNG